MDYSHLTKEQIIQCVKNFNIKLKNRYNSMTLKEEEEDPLLEYLLKILSSNKEIVLEVVNQNNNFLDI